jgi:hypothetical protein
MSFFPQIGAGSVAQFPLRRRRTWRAIENRLESGERISLPDTASGQVEWQLSFQELTDAESTRLSDFFAAARGRFGSFLFIDPMANLLGWSEDLARPDWQSGLLQSVAGVADPLGTNRASSITNSSPGTQSLQQAIAMPGEYVACFSVWIRTGISGPVTIGRDGRTKTFAAGPVWKRAYISGAGTAGSSQSSFFITLAAGQTVDAWGFQAEAQPYASQYKQSRAARGIYEETYFGTDELKITNTGVGLSSCEVVLASRV